ncbi:hypothetical protein [Nocardioides yefusunii]|uniref:PqqD family peptide modification chaperone n=1 Tax=Nocardioides yefusunii TaxID=2500546 RepID=A0ABW1QVW6_9ACTN|nr:hypothetical protein [Nocardioides yefusunii]
MVTELSLDVMGVRVVLDLGGADAEVLRGCVEHAWDRCLVAPGSAGPEGSGTAVPARRVEVVLDPDTTVVDEARSRGAVVGTTEIVVMDELTTRLVREGLEALVGDRWLLHACALGDPETGATVVLVAPSGTGKTTASRTLATSFGYVTDETAVIERDGTITPFPKPLSLLVDGRRPKRQVSPTELGMLPSPPTPWLAKVALLSRHEDAEGVVVEEVALGEGLAQLAEQTSSLHLLEDPLASATAILQARGGLTRLVYSESADLVPVVRGWLDAADRSAIGPAPVPGAPLEQPWAEPAAESESEPAAEDSRGEKPARLRRCAVLDEFAIDETVVVLLEGQVLTLSPVAGLVLDLVGETGAAGMEVAALEAAMEEAIGVPAEGTVADALTPIVDDMVTRGLVERM